MKSKNKTFSRVSVLLSQVKNLRVHRAKLTKGLEEVDAKIADLELEWNDVQKEISDEVFGRVQTPPPVKGEEKLAKKTKKVSKKKAARNAGGREAVLVAAGKRDERVREVIQWWPGMHIREIALKVNDGTMSQVQTSLKRLKAAGKIACIGTGRNATYKPLVKLIRKKKKK